MVNDCTTKWKNIKDAYMKKKKKNRRVVMGFRTENLNGIFLIS